MKRVLLLICLLNSGCLIVPTVRHSRSDEHRWIITEESADFIEPGHTTRAQVLLKLGEPDYVWDGGARFLYYWQTADAVFLFGVGNGYSGAGGAMDIGWDWGLYLRFDPAGIVREVERDSKSMFGRGIEGFDFLTK